MDVVVEGKALLDTGLTSCCIGIDDGKIVKIGKIIERADKKYDFSNLLVLPAAVDMHVHFRDPGLTEKEDFETGSMAAACGGVSYVLDMPNTLPPTRRAADVKEKIKIASKKSYVDFGIAALLDEKTHPDKVASIAAAFKIFYGETTGKLGVPAESLRPLIASVSKIELPVLVHAENIRPLPDIHEKDLLDHSKRRSEGLELEAVKYLCDTIGKKAKIHLLHVTQAEILNMARDNGFTTEITPHHLLLDMTCGLGTRGKINPPLRSQRTRAMLWEAFARGLNDTIGSDHSPHTIDEKSEDFDVAPSGMPGVETLLPLMLMKVAEKELNLALLANRSATRPAEILGLKKGRIAKGYDGDLIAVDLRHITKIRADRLHSKCGWTPYEGMNAIFPSITIIRGEEVAKDSHITGERIGRPWPSGAEKS